MANTKKIQANELDVEVLYQKLGDRWFAFSIVNDEVFMSPVSDDQITVARKESNWEVRDTTDFDVDATNDNGTTGTI